ncbi:uncharacterized protein LOC110030057 [Phalaenopsis equestris]|uniref:uncharacterized protein LOC110030057 n=1 Tax=Phalaenopsis equestris TaxID=78828 RepID=UPI0009E3CF23|nr:uncharacterized protein LOC110030057 [Phalaenopsis equestris]
MLPIYGTKMLRHQIVLSRRLHLSQMESSQRRESEIEKCHRSRSSLSTLSSCCRSCQFLRSHHRAQVVGTRALNGCNRIRSGLVVLASCPVAIAAEPDSEGLFAVYFVLPGWREISVETVLDSSGYFVLRIEDGRGEHAFIRRMDLRKGIRRRTQKMIICSSSCLCHRRQRGLISISQWQF